ncbi:DUF4129 domain-containing protein [Plantactinospora sp. CA-290183]|uniref:DUF4129 domain-containing protein n=1 Tax=Plantactinospora sp. CA-290183 TaxID=3240006 RepID=UPI003D8B1710
MTGGPSDRARSGDPPTRSTLTAALLRNWWPPVAVVGLLGLAALASANSSLGVGRVEPPADIVPTLQQPAAPAGVEATQSAPPAAAGPHLPDWIALLGAALCGAVVLGVVVILLWTLVRDVLRRRPTLTRRRRGPARPAGQATEEVVAALDAGLVDLSDTDGDPRRAVIACWVRLEQAADAAGVERLPGDTPTDLVTRLLRGGRPVSADVLSAFAEVYREARYATHTVDERMRAQAVSALRRLRAELTAEVSEVPG